MDWFSNMFPYALKRLQDGSIVVLNRFYKPLGFDPERSGWIEYESLPIAFETKLSWAQLAIRLGYEIQPRTDDFIFLYSSRTRPLSPSAKLLRKSWDAYVEKLETLARTKLILPRK